METSSPLNEAMLAREALKRLADPKGALARAAQVLRLVANSSVGLGEVLLDYAVQGYGQLCDIARAARDAESGMPGQAEDKETLGNIHYTLKSIKSALEMIPAAMQRNKSDALGERERLSRADIVEITHAFSHCPEIARLLEEENSGALLAGLVTEAVGAPAAAGQPHYMASAAH